VRTRVALLDDNERFRSQLARRLSFFSRIDLLFHAGSAEEFFRLLDDAAAAPDVALLDIGLPGTSGIQVAAQLAHQHPDIGILMLTVFEEPDKIVAAIRAGASGYLLKDTPAEALVEAIVELQQGGVPLSRPVARHVLRLMAARTAARKTVPAPEPGNELSPREIELLERIVQGDTEAEIAERLCISPHTVRTHVKNIYRKLRVRSRAAAVRLAYEQQLLDRDS